MKKFRMNDRKGAGIAWGVCTLCIMLLVTAALITALIYNGTVNESAASGYGFLAQLISCFVGFLITGKMADNKVAIQIGIVGALYLVITAACGLLLLDGSLQNYWKTLLSFAIAFVLACALCIRNPNHKRVRKRGYR